MEKQQNHTNWGPTDSTSVARGLTATIIFLYLKKLPNQTALFMQLLQKIVEKSSEENLKVIKNTSSKNQNILKSSKNNNNSWTDVQLVCTYLMSIC